MKEMGETLEALAKFFNDLIGAWIPGTVLTFGLIMMHLGPTKFVEIAKSAESAPIGLCLGALLFAIGHILLSVYEHALYPMLRFLRLAKNFDQSAAKRRDSYISFEKLAAGENERNATQSWNYHDLRSLALSVSAEAASIGRRFMFISLLCRGVATALAFILIDFIFCLIFSPKTLYLFDQAAPWYVQVGLLSATAWVLLRQGEAFNKRAMETPFAVAVAEIKWRKTADGTNRAT